MKADVAIEKSKKLRECVDENASQAKTETALMSVEREVLSRYGT
jgi:hypothetical protein